MKRLRWTIISISLFLMFSSNASAINGDRNERFKALLLNEFREHPAGTVQDMYKFIHQSSMGPGHWKMDFEMAIRYLNSEIQLLSKDSAQPLCQFLSPDSELIRINLRPYLAMHGNIDSLAEAFVRTSNEFHQSETALENNLTVLLQAVKEQKLPFDADTVQTYIRRMRSDRYPAVHHSPMYEKKYGPAYRVVFRKYLPVNIRYATYKN